MLITIIFVLILLIGISLFVAVVGTAFLRKHARRVTRSQFREYYSPPRRSEDRYRREYERRVRADTGPEIRQAPAYASVPERDFPVRRPRGGGSEGKWFLITILVLVLIIFSFYFGIKGYQNFTMKPRLFFCERVDYVRKKPVNSSDTFTRGNVTLFLKSRSPLEMTKARVEIFKIDYQGLDNYASQELPLKPDWTSFSFKALFDQIGTFTVMVYDTDDRLITQENIHIVPDSYAYKPVLK